MKKIINICFLLIVSIMLFSGISFAAEWEIPGHVIEVGTRTLGSDHTVRQLVIRQEGSTALWYGKLADNNSDDIYMTAFIAYSLGAKVRAMYDTDINTWLNIRLLEE